MQTLCSGGPMDSLPGFLQRLWARPAGGPRTEAGRPDWLFWKCQTWCPRLHPADSGSTGEAGRLRLGRRTFVISGVSCASDQVRPAGSIQGSMPTPRRIVSLEATLEMLGTEEAEGQRGQRAGCGAEGCLSAPSPTLYLHLTSRGPCSPSLFFTENAFSSCEAP